MKINKAHFIFAALIAAAYFCTSCSKGPSPHLKRGDDWLKMSDYTQAASEFSQSVTDEPSNVEGHVGLIKSLLGLHRYDDALNEIDVVKRLEPTGSRAAELTKFTEDSLIQFFNSPNSGMTIADAMNKLDLLRKIGSSQSVSLLKTLMGNSSVQLATKAESVLQVLSPSDVQATLDALLDSSNVEVRNRTAKRLWNEIKSEKAGKVLLAIAESQATGSEMENGLQSMDELGYGLAKEFYKKVITSSENYTWQLITACINRVSAAHDSDMKGAVIEMLRNHYMSDSTKIIGYSPTQPSLEYLASLGDKTFIPELKTEIGRRFMIQDGIVNTRWPKTQEVILLLNKMDGNKWNSFIPYGTDIAYLIDTRSDKLVDHSPEDSTSIAQFYSLLGQRDSMAIRGWDKLIIRSADVLDADRIKMDAYLTEGDSLNVIYNVELVFRGTGISERPWLLTKVQNIAQVASRIGGNANSFLESGKLKYDQKDYDGAIADYNKGLLWRPDDNNLLRNRGWAEAFKGDYDSAINDAKMAVEKAGPLYGDQEACLLYGFAKLRKGDYNGAIEQFDSMIAAGQQTATAYQWRAAAKEKTGDLDGAISDYRKAIDTDPKLRDELLLKIDKAKAAAQH